MYSVLIADDEAATRNGLKAFLDWKSLGVEQVLLASDGAEALRLAKQEKPDIIISDIRMPKLNGIAFTTKLREALPHVRLIFISGYSDKEYMKSAIQLRAIRYVEKPIAPQELYSALKEAVSELEKETMVRTLTERSQLLRQELALKLTESGGEEETLREKIELACPAFLRHRKYRTILLTQSGGTPILGSVYTEVERLACAEFGSCLMAHTGTNHLLFQISSAYMDNTLLFKNRLSEFLKSARSCLSGEPSCFAAAGECVFSLKELYRSYETAGLAEHALFFTGYDACVLYDKNTIKKYVLPDKTVESFEDLLRGGSREETLSLLAGVTEGLGACPATDDGYVRHFLFQFAERVCEVARERGIDPAAAGVCYDTLRQTFFGGGLFLELYGALCELLEHYFTELDALRKNRPVYLVKQSIEKNYADNELSIQDIADQVHLTPSHICHIFKKETGQTVNQYLTSLRIEKAKLLLRKPDVRLASVTEQIGYTDANYFTRQFKKQVGKTPSEYRDEHLKQGEPI